MFFQLAASNKWSLQQGDVERAFLNGKDIERDLFFWVPEGGLPDVKGSEYGLDRDYRSLLTGTLLKALKIGSDRIGIAIGRGVGDGASAIALKRRVAARCSALDPTAATVCRYADSTRGTPPTARCPDRRARL